MKRLTLVVVLVSGVAAALAGWALSAPAERPTAASHPAATQALPPLPAAVRNRKRWIIGVKCDAPPFGYIDVRGHNQGFDIEVAHWFARYAFGKASRVSFVCAPTPAREPLRPALSAIEGSKGPKTSVLIKTEPEKGQQGD